MRLGLAVIGLTLSACNRGNTTDLRGMYSLTAYTQDATGCGPGVAPVPAPAFMQVRGDGTPGQLYYNVAVCTSSDATTCTDIANNLVETDNGDAAGDTATASGAGATCRLTFQTASALMKSDGLTVEQRTFSDVGMFTSCTPDAARTRARTMPCAGYAFAIGTKVN